MHFQWRSGGTSFRLSEHFTRETGERLLHPLFVLRDLSYSGDPSLIDPGSGPRRRITHVLGPTLGVGETK